VPFPPYETENLAPGPGETIRQQNQGGDEQPVRCNRHGGRLREPDKHRGARYGDYPKSEYDYLPGHKRLPIEGEGTTHAAPVQRERAAPGLERG
jgi:hypothetical protein